MAVRAAVLSIGSELLRGDISDTNATFLTRALSHLGFHVQRVEQVGDDLNGLERSIKSALSIAEVVVCTGGLGPTQDDLTRQAIARAVNEELRIDNDLVKDIESRFAAMGRHMPERNRQQAFLIPAASAINNPNGTAPGWYVEKDSHVIAAMPGPPQEMEPMWNDSVQARLERLLPGTPAMVALMTFGLGESTVEQKIDDVIQWRPDVTVATYAKSTGVEVHITARAGDPQDAKALAHEAEVRIRERLGRAVFGSGTDTLSSAVGRLLDECGLSVAVMESCTGGLLASMITDNPGSSEHFRGGLVAYSPDAKAEFGVDIEVMSSHGLISAETALSMANAARAAFHSDIGLGVTGVAGTEAVEDKPPGTVFLALHTPEANKVQEIHRPGRRETIKHFAAQCTLDMLRRHLEASMTAHP